MPFSYVSFRVLPVRGSARQRRRARPGPRRERARKERDGRRDKERDGKRDEPAAPELARDRAGPGEQMARRLRQGGRYERERGQERDRVPVHRPDEARETVEAEPRPPVQVRLEGRERERARDVEGDGAEGQPPEPQPRRDALRAEPGALAHAEGRQPDDEDRHRRRNAERDQGHGDEAGAARRALEHPRERAGRDRVSERASTEHEQRDHGGPEQEPGLHRTFSVNGADITRPRSRNWRKSRQVPAIGSSTPTLSFPGPSGRPTTVAPPRTLVQPGVSGPQT